MPRRYAIYFTPPDDTALARFGDVWFAPVRNRLAADKGNPPMGLPGLPLRRQLDVTAEPAVYGLHATLKPPFALAPGCTRAQVFRTARLLAACHAPIRLPRLRLDVLDGFLALRPACACPRAAELAAACVRAFDPLRAQPSPDELDRRRARGLGGRQEALLCRWGYPFVLDQWHFHMTLTRRLERCERPEIAARLAPPLRHATREAPVLDAITVCEQHEPHQPFHVAARFPLGAPRCSRTVEVSCGGGARLSARDQLSSHGRSVSTRERWRFLDLIELSVMGDRKAVQSLP